MPRFNHGVVSESTMVSPSQSTMVAMKTIAERLKEARITRRLKQSDLAQAAGVTSAAISALESGQTKSPTPETLFPLARRLGVSAEWLITGRGEELPGESHEMSRFETTEGYVRFPLLEGFAGMGKGDYIGDYPEVVESLRVSRDWVERKLPGVPPEAIRVITGRGDSMKGQFNDGDLIFLDTRVKAFDQDSAYCFRWEGRVLVKRLQFVGRGMLRILSKNPDYPAIDAPIEDIEIGGRALAAWTLKEF